MCFFIKYLFIEKYAKMFLLQQQSNEHQKIDQQNNQTGFIFVKSMAEAKLIEKNSNYSLFCKKAIKVQCNN